MDTSDLFLDHLDRSGLLGPDGVDRQKIIDTPRTHLAELAWSLSEATRLTAPTSERERNNILQHSASLELSGAPTPCAALGCRQRNAASLARFAALYSDRVYVQMPFTASTAHADHGPAVDDTRYKDRFCDHLAVIHELRPLIAKGLVVPVTTAQYCEECLSNSVLGADASHRLKKLISILVGRFIEDVELELQPQGNGIFLTLRGPETLLSHPAIRRIWPLPPSLIDGVPSIKRRVLAGQTVTLSRNAKRHSGLAQWNAQRHLNRFLYDLLGARETGAPFLTTLESDIELFAGATSAATRDRSALIQQHLSTIVPIAADVPTAKLVTLREREADAFLIYRQSLMKAVETVLAAKKTFTAADAKQLYQDVVRPALAKLDQKVRSAKRDLISKVGTEAAAWAGVIGIGLYSGIIHGDVGTVVGTLGAVKLAAGLVQKAVNVGTRQSAIRNEEWYYLWKVRRLVTRSERRS